MFYSVKIVCIQHLRILHAHNSLRSSEINIIQFRLVMTSKNKTEEQNIVELQVTVEDKSSYKMRIYTTIVV